MIPIRVKELAGAIHSCRVPSRRFIVVFRFYCDESHDNPKVKKSEPKSYVVGGLFGDERTFDEKVEPRWLAKNRRAKVARYHAAHLNARTWEYEGWKPEQALRYSKRILAVLKDQNHKLHGFGCGMHVDEYRRIINQDGQRKMGHPYLVCFKSVIAMVAQQMDYARYRREDTFAVILDQNKDRVDGRRLDAEAVRIFYEMKDNPKCSYRHRLESCTPEDSEKLICLQPADFVAYELFRLMHGKRNGAQEMRAALDSMLGSTGFMFEMFGEESLMRLKGDIEKTVCGPNELVVIPKYTPRETNG
jgi:hypothetical protein